jgi:hypothetical protein
VWKALLAGLLLADIGGGAVANFTESTNRYYEDRGSLRIPFISIHLLHFLVLSFIFQDQWLLFGVSATLVVGGGLCVNALRSGESQMTLAALICTMGMLTIFVLPPAGPIHVRIPCVLMLVKIVLGFAVRRYPGSGTR